jgi:hypothetical protein
MSKMATQKFTVNSCSITKEVFFTAVTIENQRRIHSSRPPKVVSHQGSFVQGESSRGTINPVLVLIFLQYSEHKHQQGADMCLFWRTWRRDVTLSDVTIRKENISTRSSLVNNKFLVARSAKTTLKTDGTVSPEMCDSNTSFPS